MQQREEIIKKSVDGHTTKNLSLFYNCTLRNLCKKAKASGGVVKKYEKGQLKAEKLALDKQIQMGPLPLAPSGPMQAFAQYQPLYQRQYPMIPQYFGMPPYQPAYHMLYENQYLIRTHSQ